MLKLHEHRLIDGREEKGTEFLVEWVGYHERSWEPADVLPLEMVQQYVDEHDGLELVVSNEE